MTTTPSTTGFAIARDGVPTVGTTAERDARFPLPPRGFKVYNIEVDAFQRWTGAAWVTSTTQIGTSAATYGFSPSASAAANGFALQAAIDATPDTGRLIIPPGTYAVSGVPVINARSGITIDAYGAKLSLSGVGTFGLKFSGLNVGVRILGLTVVGSGVLADGHRGIATVNDPAVASGSDLRIEDCTVTDCVVGIYLTVQNLADWRNVNITNCTVLRSVGTASGQGYGIVLSGVYGGEIAGCYVDQCQRHGIYISACSGINVLGGTIRRNRNGVSTGGQFGGLEIARSSQVTAIGITFDANEDGACDIEPTDLGGLASDGIILSGCTFLNSTHWDIRIGGQGPATSAELRGVLVKHCTFTRPTGATNSLNPIRIEHGLSVQIQGCHFYALNAYTVSIAMIYVVGAQAAIYTQDVEIDDNTVTASGNSGGGVQLVLIGTTLCTASQRIAIRRNTLRYSGTSSFNILMAYAATRTSTTIAIEGNNYPDTQFAVANAGQASQVSPWDFVSPTVNLTDGSASPTVVTAAIQAALQYGADFNVPVSFSTKFTTGSLFRVNSQIVVSGDVIRIDGHGGSLHAVGTRIQWVTGSASYGLRLQSVAGAAGNGSTPSGYCKNLTLLKESGLAADGSIGLQLLGLRQFHVDQVTPDGFEIGFDLISNCFGAQFSNCRVWQNPSAYVGINIRTGTESGNDISFYNCWIAGLNAAVHIAGGSTNFHFKGGQLTAGQGQTADQDGLGVIIFGKDYLTSATAAMGILDLDGVDFENAKRMWLLRGYQRVQLNVQNCAFLANESGAQPMLGLYKFEGLNDSKVRFSNCTIRGVYSSVAMFSEAGANSGYGILEDNWLSTTPTTVNGSVLGAGWFLSSRAYAGTGRGLAVEHTSSRAQLRLNGAVWLVGTGTPEAAVAAPVGSMFTRTDGGASTTLYVKETGAATNTGWVAK